MNKTRNILTGIGSILDFMPNRERCDLSKTVHIMTPEQINTAAWEMVGKSFRMAMGQVQHGTQAKRPRK